VSEKVRRWLVVGIMLFGIVPFLAISILPFFGSQGTEQTAVQETTTPSPTAAQQVSPAAQQEQLKKQQEQLKQQLLGGAKGLESLLQKEPDNQTALRQLFQLRKELVQIGAGDAKQAIEPLEKLIQLNPQDLSLQLELGSFYVQQQRFDDAIAIYDNAIKLDAQDFRPLLAKGIVLQLQGKKEEAKPLFDSATNLAPAALKQQVKAQVDQIQILTSPPPTAPAPTPASPNPTATPSDNQTGPATPAPTTTPETNNTSPSASPTGAAAPETNNTSPPASPTPAVTSTP
jgi:tetratricopeptide (TPR) repeat protein